MGPNAALNNFDFSVLSVSNWRAFYPILGIQKMQMRIFKNLFPRSGSLKTFPAFNEEDYVNGFEEHDYFPSKI